MAPHVSIKPPLSLSSRGGGLAVSHRARVQRGESATARCASTGNRQVGPPRLGLRARIEVYLSRLDFACASGYSPFPSQRRFTE